MSDWRDRINRMIEEHERKEELEADQKRLKNNTSRPRIVKGDRENIKRNSIAMYKGVTL